MCQSCVNFITAFQTEAKANSSFVNSLIANYENKCDELGPGMSDMVRAPQNGGLVHIFMSKMYINRFYSLQCKQYISQYGPVVVQQLMSMVSLLSSFFRFIDKVVHSVLCICKLH